MKRNIVKYIVDNPYVILATFIATFVGAIVSIVSCFLGNSIWSIISSVILIISIVIIVIYAIHKWFSYNRLKSNIIEHQGDGIHQLCEQLTQCEDSIGVFCASLRNKDSISYASLRLHLNGICEKIRKCLELIVQLYLDERCSFGVCIKEIKTLDILDNDISTWSTQTIARACDEYIARSNNDDTPQKISDNTSFYETLINNISWVSRNLEETKANYKKCGKEYRNPDPLYMQYYQSTIVVPVKQKKQYVSDVVKEYGKDKSCGNDHYLAFLCIDSKRTFPDDELFDVLVTFTTMCAKMLYPVLEEHLVNKIEEV